MQDPDGQRSEAAVAARLLLVYRCCRRSCQHSWCVNWEQFASSLLPSLCSSPSFAFKTRFIILYYVSRVISRFIFNHLGASLPARKRHSCPRSLHCTSCSLHLLFISLFPHILSRPSPSCKLSAHLPSLHHCGSRHSFSVPLLIFLVLWLYTRVLRHSFVFIAFFSLLSPFRFLFSIELTVSPSLHVSYYPSLHPLSGYSNMRLFPLTHTLANSHSSRHLASTLFILIGSRASRLQFYALFFC